MSDLHRGRSLAWAAGVSTAVSLAAVLAAGEEQAASPGPLSRSHAVAGLSCGACHGSGRPAERASGACAGCHGRHDSTRDAHRALAAKGALACNVCHEAHGNAAEVSFGADGKGIFSVGSERAPIDARGPAGATVPLVPSSACRACHTDEASDPAKVCLAGGPDGTSPGPAGAWSKPEDFSRCFDEHERPSAPAGGAGVCARQHGASRFVAWEATRSALDAGRGQLRAVAKLARDGRWSVIPWLLALAFVAGGAAFAAASVWFRPGRRQRLAPASPSAPERVRLPVIDASRCLGCAACVDVCPFDVLAVGQYVAKVARPDACCGVGACETACPNGSLRLAAEGDPQPDRPRLDERLESLDAPGIFVAGDLTGVPLIRNAILQGAAVAERAAEALLASRRSREPSPCLDLAVIGAGPAGLSAALRAKELGLACTVFEQSTIAATVRAFPRGKIVHDPPLELPLEGALWLRESTKEELLAQWARIVRTHRLDVRENHRVTSVTRGKEGLLVQLTSPDGPKTVRARRVVLAVGRRGTPRKLAAEVAKAAAASVLSSLSDARALAGKRVVVVGLGDTAMEAVVAVGRQPGTEVTVSYRGSDFARGRAKNIEQVKRLVAAGRVNIVFRSVVARVDQDGVVLSTPEGELRVRADVVLALLGGEPPRALLEASGIRFDEA
jgi:thioredoxin reductase/Pyruvate/2-oxoacid:ferredoxin oxidoreductase delta subunit